MNQKKTSILPEAEIDTKLHYRSNSYSTDSNCRFRFYQKNQILVFTQPADDSISNIIKASREIVSSAENYLDKYHNFVLDDRAKFIAHYEKSGHKKSQRERFVVLDRQGKFHHIYPLEVFDLICYDAKKIEEWTKFPGEDERKAKIQKQAKKYLP